MSFSNYLIGTWEKRFNVVNTTIQIINPTLREDLNVIVAFFNNNGVLLACRIKEPLGPNSMWEVSTMDAESAERLHSQFGVVKVISYLGEDVVDGIVAFQRQILAIPTPFEVAFSETLLAAVPVDAQEEFNKIMASCP